MAVNLGQGSLGYTPGKQPATPATVTGANNGVSLDGANVQLGQDVGEAGNPAALLDNREIPLSNFSFHFKGDTVGILIDDANAIFSASNSAGNKGLLTDFLNHLFEFGDIDGIGNNLMIAIDDTGNQIGIGKDPLNLQPGLYIDYANQYYALGDDFGNNNGTEISLNDTVGKIQLFTPVNSNFASLTFESQDAVIRIGDLSNKRNGNFLKVDDLNSKIFIDNIAHNAIVNINGGDGFTGTVSPVNSITVNGGIVTAVS